VINEAVPILPAIFRRLKAKSKILGKGENLEKWMSENCNLAYFALQRWRNSTRIVTNRIELAGKIAKDRDTLIQQSCMLKSWRYTRKIFMRRKITK